jgi:hypothetical protein
MSFTVNITKRVRVRLPWLSTDEQRELGQFAIDTMQRRIRGGIGIDDQPVIPLSEGYARVKSQRGQPPVRNLFFTGAMLNDMTVLETGSVIRIGFPDPRQALKAGVNQNRAPMIGLSRFDQRQLIHKHDELLARSIVEFIEERAA